MIKTAFSSWESFWAMGGYGFYVWWSLAISGLVLALLVWAALACWQRQKAAAVRYWQQESQEKNQRFEFIIEESSSTKD